MYLFFHANSWNPLEIIEHPRTTLAKENYLVYLSCEIADEPGTHLLYNEEINSAAPNAGSDLAGMGIHFYCSNGRCNTSILANDENDGLIVQCAIHGCCTREAMIYVVDGKPAVIYFFMIL